uniref:Cell division protein n=1 Tax=Prototheca zopfii TaxID=3112 RepID=A0A2P1G7N3_9CHLO|nr:cell division protein [Prototheca ciferrii]AVM80963.1 cell division protein [Prototheca ciferrii]
MIKLNKLKKYTANYWGYRNPSLNKSKTKKITIVICKSSYNNYNDDSYLRSFFSKYSQSDSSSDSEFVPEYGYNSYSDSCSDSDSDFEYLDDFQNEQQDKIDESFERIVEENQELIDKETKESKKVKRVNYKHYANIDPTYEYTELDMYVNMVRYRIFLDVAETIKKVLDEQLTFDFCREEGIEFAVNRTALFKRYYTKERLVNNKLYKRFKTYRLIIGQFFMHIANVHLNYIYWFLVIQYRSLKIILKFLVENAYLIFIDYPRALAIQYLTIKNKIILYIILYFECITVFSLSLKTFNKEFKTAPEDYSMNSLMTRRRNLLTRRHRDSLPFTIKSNKDRILLTDLQLYKKRKIPVTRNFKYIYKKAKHFFVKKFKSRRFRYYQRRRYKRRFLTAGYPSYRDYIRDVAFVRGIQKGIMRNSFRAWNMKRDVQKQLKGYQFPELNLVNTEQQAINIPDFSISTAKKYNTLPYNFTDFDRDIERYAIESKEDDLSYDWGTFRHSQVVSDPVTSAKDILLYTISQNFSKTWHGHADYDLYLDEVFNILFHWHIISQGDYNRLLAYERKRKKVTRKFFHWEESSNNVPFDQLSRNFDLYFPMPHMMAFFELPALYRLNRKDPESWRKLFLMNLVKVQEALYEGPLLPFDKNRDIIFGGSIECGFEMPNLFSVFETLITPDRSRRKSVYNLRGSKRYRGRFRSTKLYSNYERSSLRKRLWANLFTGEAYNRLLLNEYKSSKHLKEDASTLLYRRINKGERMTAGNPSYLAFPEYHNVKTRRALAGNAKRNIKRAYRSKLMKYEEKRELEGPKKLESELFTDQLVRVIRDFNGNRIDQDTINAHIGKGGSIRMKFNSFGSDESFEGVVVELLPLNQEYKYMAQSGFHNFVDLNKKGSISFIKFYRLKLFDIILNIVGFFSNLILSTIYIVGSIDLFGLVPDYLEFTKITSTEDIFVENQIPIALLSLLVFSNTIVLYFFWKIQGYFIRGLAIYTLDYLFAVEQDYANVPMYSTIKFYIADWYNLSYFLPYTIYKKFDVNFASVAGIDRYVSRLHELFEVVGYKPILYSAPEFLLRPIMEERKFLRDNANLEDIRQTHLILSGAPGTGKTYLVKALGGELGLPILLFTPHQFIGGLEDKVQRLFEKAEKLAPCLVFIDEIDSIGYARPNIDLGQDKISIVNRPDTYKSFSRFLSDRKGFSTIDIYKYGNPFTGYIGTSIEWRDCLNQIGLDPTEELFNNIEKYIDYDQEIYDLHLRDHEYDRSMLYRLLIECDGLTGRLANKPEKRPTWSILSLLRRKRGIGVIGATNRYYVLDPALVRVGRFHTRLHFETLNKNERYFLCQMRLGINLRFDEDINWFYIVDMTSGWTPAELSAVVGHSNMIAYEKGVSVITQKMLTDSMNYILGVNLLTDRTFTYQERGDLYLFQQTSCLFFDYAFQTGTNRDVYSKYIRLDDVNLASFRHKIASYFTISDRDKDFFEGQLIGLLGPKIGEVFFHLYKEPEFSGSSENPIVISFNNDITLEYVAIFVSLMIDYWCLYADDSLMTGEALLALTQLKRFSFEKNESVLDALAIKIMSARMDHPEFQYLHDLFHFLFNKTPESVHFLKLKLDWYFTYGVQFGLGKYTEGINPYVTQPTIIHGHNVSLKFSSSILLDFLGFQGDVIEHLIYDIIVRAVCRGCDILFNNVEAFEFTKDKLVNTDYLRILDMNTYFKQTTIKINCNYEKN